MQRPVHRRAPAERWRQLAAASLGLTGLGHLATELLAPATPERTAMLGVMRGWQVSLPGIERSVAELFFGFSVMMGVLLVGCAALMAAAPPSRSGRLVMVGLTLVATVVAWRYFFPVPGVLTSVAAFAALMSWRGEARALP